MHSHFQAISTSNSKNELETYHLAMQLWRKAQALWRQDSPETISPRKLAFIDGKLAHAESLFHHLTQKNVMSELAQECFNNVGAFKKHIADTNNYFMAKKTFLAARESRQNDTPPKICEKLYQKAASTFRPLAADDFMDSVFLLDMAECAIIELQREISEKQRHKAYERENAVLESRFKSIEYQLRSIYSLSHDSIPMISTELNAMIKVQLRLNMLAPTLVSNASLNALLKISRQLGKDLPLHDLKARNKYINELYTELNSLNRVCNDPIEQEKLVQQFMVVDKLLETNKTIFKSMFARQDFRTDETFKIASEQFKTAQLALNSKLKQCQEANVALREEPQHFRINKPKIQIDSEEATPKTGLKM